MNLARRGRSIAVSGFLLAGSLGIISSTQTWLTVERADAGEAILVPGAAALPLLAPLSLAVLALAAALSLTGPIIRLVLGVLGTAAALFLGWTSLQVLVSTPDSAVAPTIAEKTGLAGDAALTQLVTAIVPSAWPVLALVGWVILLLSAILVLLTGLHWKRGGRRYRTDIDPAVHDAGPVDSVDSWDELSRGTDPTR